MKVQIRQGVFETNSSSTHSLSMCLETEWRDFESGKIWMRSNGDGFIDPETAKEENEKTLAERKAICKKHGWSFDEDDYDYLMHQSYQMYMDNLDRGSYEQFVERRILSDGTSVIGFGYFGYDG